MRNIRGLERLERFLFCTGLHGCKRNLETVDTDIRPWRRSLQLVVFSVPALLRPDVPPFIVSCVPCLPRQKDFLYLLDGYWPAQWNRRIS